MMKYDVGTDAPKLARKEWKFTASSRTVVWKIKEWLPLGSVQQEDDVG